MRMLSVQLVRILLHGGGNVLIVIIAGCFVSGLCVWVTGGPRGQGGEEAGGAGGD